jgi:hypothetical protein
MTLRAIGEARFTQHAMTASEETGFHTINLADDYRQIYHDPWVRKQYAPKQQWDFTGSESQKASVKFSMEPPSVPPGLQPWQPGYQGKALMTPDGRFFHWRTEGHWGNPTIQDGHPAHFDVASDLSDGPTTMDYIPYVVHPEGHIRSLRDDDDVESGFAYKPSEGTQMLADSLNVRADPNNVWYFDASESQGAPSPPVKEAGVIKTRSPHLISTRYMTSTFSARRRIPLDVLPGTCITSPLLILSRS